MGHGGKEQVKVLGLFNKDKDYTIAEINGQLFALYKYSEGKYEKKYECEHFGGKLYGIGKQIA